MPPTDEDTPDFDHRKTVDDILEREAALLQMMQPYYQGWVKYWKLYLADREDKRSADELWRADIWVPDPFVITETRVAVQSDIFNSPDPPIQAEGVGDEDAPGAKPIELLLDYQLRKMSWRKKNILMSRACSVQGTDFFKTVYVNQSHVITTKPDRAEFEAFAQSLMEAMNTGAPPPPDPIRDPKGFEVWRQLINAGGKAKVREAPFSGQKTIVRYRGPSLERLNAFDIRLDPLVEDIEDQPLIIHHYVKPKSWLQSRTGQDAKFPYDPAAVEEAIDLEPAEIDKLSQYFKEVAAIMDVSLPIGMDRFHERMVEIHECWDQADQEMPFKVILNQKTVINKTPNSLPYQHGECAIGAVRNVWVPGFALGLSDYQQSETLFYEKQALRNLRLDGTTLAVLPALQKPSGYGLPDSVRSIKPGSIISTPRPDAIKRLIEMNVPAEAYREHEDIKFDIQEATATYPNVRGAAASVGRVSATENQQRLSQALARIKLTAVQTEEDLTPFVRQSLGLWYQFGDPELRLKVGGADPLLTISKADIFEAMEVDYRFRGATRAVNRDLQIQQMLSFAKDMGANLLPREMRALMLLIWENFAIRGGSKIISEDGTRTLQTNWDLQNQMAMAQLTGQMDQSAAAGVGVPASIPVDEAQALMEQGIPPGEDEQGGGGQAPPAAAAPPPG
jgi:hypothetical protein